MIIETLTIIYYSIASLSIGLVLCQTYNTEIRQCINKWIYNYEPVNTEENDENDENDLGLENQLNNDNETYILFNEINNDEINNNKNIKTKKNVIIDFE
tara:strand:+ start:113 stop:409 length:297 start_codon:yes stop_codon:yes gene_type:complete